jgi:hypothetical protein
MTAADHIDEVALRADRPHAARSALAASDPGSLRLICDPTSTGSILP